ncbi:MAG: hypothetical protein HFI37_06300 [Lachnospiraceae bacterium]|nr:hypothetical protein [Lachnospiraceae bacterium]
MDISDLLKQGNLSPEKLDFLMQFANQQHSKNAKEMASELTKAASTAKSSGIEFSETERDLLINILKQSMSEEERKKTDMILSLMKNMKRH